MQTKECLQLFLEKGNTLFIADFFGVRYTLHINQDSEYPSLDWYITLVINGIDDKPRDLIVSDRYLLPKLEALDNWQIA